MQLFFSTAKFVCDDSVNKTICILYPFVRQTKSKPSLSLNNIFSPGMKAMIDTLVDHGAQNVVMGMAHRGRLNVLANVLRKPAEKIVLEVTSSCTRLQPLTLFF
jgi:hypothetical protein